MEANFGGNEEEIVLDTKQKCFGCLSRLNDSRLQNIQKLFSTLNLNYSEIMKKAGGVQVERMISDGVAAELKVKLCNCCGGSLEELSRAEGDLLEVKSNMDKIFNDLLTVDKSNTLQTMQTAQLYSWACGEVGREEGNFTRIRGQLCKKIVNALEDEEKLQDFLKEKPSSVWGYFVEAFVLNLRMELNEQCKADLNLHSEAQAVPSQPATSTRSPSIGASAKSASPVPSSSTPRNSLHSFQQSPSSSSSAPHKLQTFEATEVKGGTKNPGSSSPPVLHLQLAPSTSSDPSTEKPKRAANVKATGKMAEVIDALKTDQEKGSKNGFVYKHRQHFHVHNDTHFTCRYCRKELTAGKSVRGKAWHHFFKLHFKGQKEGTRRKLKKKTIPGKINPKIGNTKGRSRGGRRGSAFKYREHFNCKGISSFDCKYCSKTYVGEDVRQAARLHFLRKHSNQKNGALQPHHEKPRFPTRAVHQSMPGRGWSSPQGFVFKAQEHFNFQGKTFCVCKYCPQSYSGAYCGNAARLHFLGRHYEEWKNQLPSSHQRDSPQASTSSHSIAPLTSNINGGASEEEVNDDSDPLDEPEVDSPLSTEQENTSASLTPTPQERKGIGSEIEARFNLNKIRHGCGMCGEHFDSQSDADKHFADKHMKFERFFN